MFKLDVEEPEEPEIKVPTSPGSWNNQERKHLLLLYGLCQSLWLCGSKQTVENFSRDWHTRPPDLPSWENCAGQEATVRTGLGTKDLLQIGKGVCQGCILSPWYTLYCHTVYCHPTLNLHVEYIMWYACLDEAQAGIKMARRNINNLRMQMTPPLWQKAKRS